MWVRLSIELCESYNYQIPNSNPPIQELIGWTTLSFQPHMCSSMPLNKINAVVKVSYPDAKDANLTSERTFSKVAIQRSTPGSGEHDFGTYSGPPQYKGKTHIQVTIAFGPLDGLSLPNSSSANTKRALRRSRDTPSFVDTKFYLFASKVDGRPANPKEIFAKSELLISSSAFLKDLLSQNTGFSNGTQCDLLEYVPEEIAKLDADAFDYDSDSDLEDDEEPKPINLKGKQRERATSTVDETGKPVGSVTQDRAFAINGTAYKTWKAFIYYTYTNEVAFNILRSQRDAQKSEPEPEDVDTIRCSPKSMYRFADYVDIPVLKSLAKEELRKCLSRSNIIGELFSSFTYRYQEIIEVEVDFLVANFTFEVARQLDEMLQMVVLGIKPHSFHVLGFVMRRLRGDSKEVAWSALDPISNSTMQQVNVLPPPGLSATVGGTTPPTSYGVVPLSPLPQSPNPLVQTPSPPTPKESPPHRPRSTLRSASPPRQVAMPSVLEAGQSCSTSYVSAAPAYMGDASPSPPGGKWAAAEEKEDDVAQGSSGMPLGGGAIMEKHDERLARAPVPADEERKVLPVKKKVKSSAWAEAGVEVGQAGSTGAISLGSWGATSVGGSFDRGNGGNVGESPSESFSNAKAKRKVTKKREGV